MPQTRQSPDSWVFQGTAYWLLDFFFTQLMWHTIPIKFSFSFFICNIFEVFVPFVFQ